MSEALTRIVAFYETLSPASLSELSALYAADAYFKDPFNEVNDIVAIEKIFAHMFEALHEPRFTVTTQVVQGDDAFLTWDFTFRMKSYRPHATQTIRGASHLKFDRNGLVAFHRDYWDAAEELYEKLPLIGTIMRLLKRRVS